MFWNNEILNTLRLEEKGLLDVYRSPAAEAYPEMFRSPDGTWHGFAARARVLIVNTKLVPDGERPKSIYDLADREVEGQNRHRAADRRARRRRTRRACSPRWARRRPRSSFAA